MYYVGKKEIKAVEKVLLSKKLYRYHASEETECDLFEKEFAAYTGAKHSLILSSGTNALVAALLSVGIRPGDEVLIPAYTFVATAGAVVQIGAIPVIVNIDDQLSLCVRDAQKRISSKTKAIIAVHMDGLSANIGKIRLFSKKNKLTLIEDVAQSIGGSYGSKKLGTFGDFGCYSLNESKNISCGEGGILICSNRELYEKAFCIHDLPAQFSPSRKDFFKKIQPFLGYSMRVSEIQGAVMRVQLSRLEKIISDLRARKEIFRHQVKNLKNVRMIEGYSHKGDCGSSIHLQFEDPVEAGIFAKKFLEKKILFAPITVRPAHAFWKWWHLFGEQGHIQKDRNPFGKMKRDFYNLSEYSDSMTILRSTLRMNVPINFSKQKMRELSVFCGDILK